MEEEVERILKQTRDKHENKLIWTCDLVTSLKWNKSAFLVAETAEKNRLFVFLFLGDLSLFNKEFSSGLTFL